MKKNSKYFKDKFSGYPSIILDHRPFFSIISPLYNTLPENLNALLGSIINQDMNDDIEVILPDDHSTDMSYQEVIDRYSDTLSIRQIKTDYNCCPGNTREKGAQYAEGEWITFIDHDDEFVPQTFKMIKDTILNIGEKYHVICNFNEVHPETFEVLRELKHTRNWMHGKFYNLDNFWKARGIHFKKDLISHEDIYVSSLVRCELYELNKDRPLMLDLTCYLWKAHPYSVSRQKYNNMGFVEQFYDQYIESTGEVYLERFMNNSSLIEPNMEWYRANCIDSFLYMYFYMQGFKYQHRMERTEWHRDNMDIARDFFVRMKEAFAIDNDFIWSETAKNNAYWYIAVRDSSYIGVGKFIESESFMDFMNTLHKDIYRRTISEI